MTSIALRLSDELDVPLDSIEATLELIEEGATIPFIARYRKEQTGGLDDVQLRLLETRLQQLTDLEARRSDVLRLLEEKGVDDATLIAAIASADTRTRIDDLYLPYQEKRRTKGQAALEAGIGELADLLLSGSDIDPEEAAAAFVVEAYPDATSVLEGARAILCEAFVEDADLMGSLRETMWRKSALRSTVIEGQESAGANFSDYFDKSEPLAQAAPHRVLAMLRGERLGHLRIEIDPLPEAADPRAPSIYDAAIRTAKGIADGERPIDKWLHETARWCWRTKARIHLETSLRTVVRERAEAEAIRVFAANLRDLLMSAPAGQRPVLAMDPGLRHGVKCAVLDSTGRIVEHAIVHPHESAGARQSALRTLGMICMRHKVEIIAIGNGTASRETEKFAGEIIRALPELSMTKAVVSESGASIYSASELASKELPDLDVSIRGAASIGRRLQDPLAELVKIDPRSIGVGQYQHDVSETLLSKALDAVVEDCVNAVGVDLNTASPHLLARVAGVGPALADAIVAHRDANGAFRSRDALMQVPRLGPKAFEQCAGFLRIRDGDQPLDRSGVHPESYPLVREILSSLEAPIESVLGNPKALARIKPEAFVSDRHGLPTIKDVIVELGKPGRDPRPAFKSATFKEGVEKPTDLRLGMILEGTVLSVTNFGAFVDIGVHVSGLVHISAMSKTYVDDPRRVVKVGDTVRTKVVSLDIPRNRIGLSMRLDDEIGDRTASDRPIRQQDKRRSPDAGPSNNALADAMRKALSERSR